MRIGQVKKDELKMALRVLNHAQTMNVVTCMYNNHEVQEKFLVKKRAKINILRGRAGIFRRLEKNYNSVDSYYMLI